MTKLQITLTDQEVNLLSLKAAALGYDVTKYAKFVLAREAEEELKRVPSYRASPTMESLIDEAIEEDNSGKTKEWPLGKHDN
jgi:hypothetical protein